MKRLTALLIFALSSAYAQSADTMYFRARMLSTNEVPPSGVDASGNATIRAHLVRDDSGEIVSGSVDFVVDYAFASAVTLTGLHIHTGAAGVSGGVVISSGLTAGSPIVDSTGRGTIDLQGQVLPDNTVGLTALRGLVADPSQYYVNLHSTDNPAGAIRGQLQAAEKHVFIGIMSPLNEVPAISGFSGLGVTAVTVLATRDASGNLTSGQLTFDLAYSLPAADTFVGYHIHGGAAGTNGGVLFNSGIGAGANAVQTDPTGAGTLHRSFINVLPGDSNGLARLSDMLVNPGNYYINIHTPAHPGGVMRGQLRSTDRMAFPVSMLPGNETPPLSEDARASAVVRAYVVRWEDGSVRAGFAEFDVNCRFGGAATFTGLHVHTGAAGVAGPVKISSGLTSGSPVVSDTGFGNIFRDVVVMDSSGAATLSEMARAPESEYVNLHTSDHLGGAVRAQLTGAAAGAPEITAVVSANLDKNATTQSPGGMITIFGTNLAKVATGLDGWQGTMIPDSLNGAAVAVDGQRARLLYVSPTQINAILSFETPTGEQAIAVNNGDAVSPPFSLTVAPVAPAVFFDLNHGGAIALKTADYSLVGSGNPAHAGDVLLLYLVGLGQTTPAVSSGQIVPSTGERDTTPVTVTVGGQMAEVIYSIASPGYAGLYQIAFRLPPGVAAGNATLVVSAGAVSSNSVTLAVQ